MLVAFAGFLVFANATSQTIETPTFGKGILNLRAKDSSWTMKFAARMQFLSIVGWQETDGKFEDPQASFLVRRARLKFGGYILSPKLEYKLELGLSNRDLGGASNFTNNSPNYILDAVIKYNFYENFVLWIGQTKLPGNRERVISSGDLALVDRSIVNSRFNIDRDVGIQIHHKINFSEKFMIKEIISVSQGEGRNITTGNMGGHQYTGKIELYPFGDFLKDGDYSGADIIREQSPKLAVAVAYDYNNNAVKNQSNLGRYMVNDVGFHETDITTLFIDTMFKYQGFSLMAEYAKREADDPIAKDSDGTPTGTVVQIGDGINLQAGYVFPSNWAVTSRFTNVTLDKKITGKDKETQYTLGFSKYIVGHKLKVQSDVSYFKIENRNQGLTFRLQMDVHF